MKPRRKIISKKTKSKKPAKPKAKYIKIEAKSMVNKVNESKANFEKGLPVRLSINPYTGCEHGCIYCYNKFMARFGGYPSIEDISRIIKVKVNAPKVLEKELKKQPQKELVWIGSVCDPYQQAEATHRITRQCLEILSRNGFPYSIVTKSDLVTRDIDLLKKDKHLNEVIFTITADDPAIKQQIEPNSPSTKKRLKAIEQLARQGINVKVFLLPIIPFLTDGPKAERLAKKIAQTGAKNIYAGLLRLSPLTWSFFSKRINPTMKQKLQELYYTKGERFGGATVPPENYRFKTLQNISKVCRQQGTGFFCEDKFFELNHEKPTPVDKWKYITPYDVWKHMKTNKLQTLSQKQLIQFARQRIVNPQFEAVLNQLGTIQIDNLKKIT